jgi:type I site-specific restriction endonuclease
LNHSRLVLIAGFLCLLGEAATRVKDSREYLQQRVGLTPLERICSSQSQSSLAQEIVSSYDQFLARMSDGEFVQRLADPEVETLHTSEFTQLEQNSQRLKTALVSSIAERSNSWPAAFRESLLL